MVVLTSLVVPCITTKINIVSDTIPGICLMFRLDVINPQNATTKVIEHQLDTLLQYTRAFNVHEIDQLYETNDGRLYLMFSNDFILSRDPRKGYESALAQDVHVFYTRSHLSALQTCALIFSTNFQFIFTFKKMHYTV